jgi:ribose transport system permease protein
MPGIKKWIDKILYFIIEYDTLLIFLIMVLISSIISDVFFTYANISNLLRQVSGIGIISMGMLLVILTGGIDLSVGSVVALTSVLCGSFLSFMPLPAALLCTVAAGIITGSASGYLVSFHRVAPFIATLALMTIARGLGFIISKGSPVIINDSETGLFNFGSGTIMSVPYPVLLMVIVFLIVYIILNYTVFGRLVIAIGSNEEAVRLSGIKLRFYKFMVYAITGGFSALAGIISTSRTGVGSPIIGTGLELDVIAAVVIGGASLSGGKGSAVNTLLGVLILGMISNIMNLQNVPAYHQQVIKGLIIVFAVLLQGLQKNSKK